MTPDEYQQAAMRTAGHLPRFEDQLTAMALGLVGEAGEVSEVVKKHIFHGHPLDAEKLVGELGDVLWYLAGLADALSVSLGAVMEANIEKLHQRYPEGFSSERSRNRPA